MNAELNEKLDGISVLLMKLQIQEDKEPNQATHSAEPFHDFAIPELTFSVHVEADTPHNSDVLCPRASFGGAFLRPVSTRVGSPGHRSELFRCSCPSTKVDTDGPHQQQLDFSCMPYYHGFPSFSRCL